VQLIRVAGEGRATSLVIDEGPEPEPGPGEVRIAVAATAVNRADLLQRRGFYPPPPGAPDVLGLECAGVVDAIGPGAAGFAPGDRVMALLPGGGYAERAVAHAGSVMRISDGMSFEEAAAVPEVFLTAYLTLFEIAGARAGEWALVHGGSGGVGTAAIQILKAEGVRVVATAGSPERCRRCVALGADAALDYREGPFAGRVLELTGGGADVVLDLAGGASFQENLRALATGGRLILIGLLGGRKAEADLAPVILKRLSILGSTLRSRSVEEKAGIVARFLARFGSRLASRAVRPVVDRVLPLERAEEAHALVERGAIFGKVVLKVSAID
jgi:putative PIG3 family NAD(P)H quinone oxidoreductase